MPIGRCFALEAGNRKDSTEQIEMEAGTDFCLGHLQRDLFQLTSYLQLRQLV